MNTRLGYAAGQYPPYALSVPGSARSALSVSGALRAPTETTLAPWTPRAAWTTISLSVTSRATVTLLKHLESINLTHVWPLKPLETITRLPSMGATFAGAI